MEKINLTLKEMQMASKMLNWNYQNTFAVMNLKDGSRMTTELHIFFTNEGPVFLNISNAKTLKFEDGCEYRKYLDKKFELYKSEKEMYKDFCGMDEETWKVWNQEEE